MAGVLAIQYLIANVNQDLLKAIGARLKRAREESGISQRDAGRHVGRSRQAISSWEAGSSEIGATSLCGLIQLYKTTGDYILLGMFAAPALNGPYFEGLASARLGMEAALNKARDVKKPAKGGL